MVHTETGELGSSGERPATSAASLGKLGSTEAGEKGLIKKSGVESLLVQAAMLMCDDCLFCPGLAGAVAKSDLRLNHRIEYAL